MSGSDRDLVLALRAELAGIDPARACDRRAEAVGLSSGRTIREGPVTRLILRLRRELDRDSAGHVDGSPVGEAGISTRPFGALFSAMCA